jgi:hypothetical protein
MSSFHVPERQLSGSVDHIAPVGTESTAAFGLTNTPEGADGALLSSSQSLAEAILDAFPSGSYAMTGLLRLLDIVATSAVPTAAVECRAQPRLLINPQFVAQHANTPEKLLMLVMHELHHVLLGHTTLFPRLTPEQNFVFDAVINGLVCRMFPDAAFTSFFADYYREDQFPDCLLRPPRGWPSVGFSTSAGLALLDPTWQKRALEVHAALYSEAGASYHEVYELLPRLLLQSGTSGLGDVPLLGGHDPGDGQHTDLQRGSPVLFDLVRELVEQWPQPPDPIRGRSLADLLNETTVSAPRVRPPRSVLRALIRKVAGVQGASRLPQISVAHTRVQSPVPAWSRRSSVLYGMGVPNLLHPADVLWKKRRQSGALVHIYLDVSGSMDGVLGPLYAAALDCEEFLHPRIHLFSTKVVDITRAELRAGRCSSTGGTSIEVVAEHMAAHDVRRALIVTDGWVGSPKGQHRRTLENALLAVAYLGLEPNRDDLSGLANHTDILSIGDAP